MKENFTRYIEDKQLFHRSEKVLLAVSGGMDSMVMVDLFSRSGWRFAIAHCNFGLRDKESDDDSMFVEQVAQKLNIPFYLVKFDTQKFAGDNKISIQMAARELRYNWLEKTRVEQDCQYIATAHHLNDSIETVLINLTKGTGISGLHGILPKMGKILRPMLFAKKSEIRDYAGNNKIKFREDSSNIISKYERNKIRLEVIPLLEELNPNLEETFRQNIENFQSTENIYYYTINSLKVKLVEKRGRELFIPFLKLKSYSFAPTLLFEILKPFGFNQSHVRQVLEIPLEESGRYFETSRYRMIKDRKFIIVTDRKTTASEYIVLPPGNQVLDTGDASFKISEHDAANFTIPKTADVACLDYEKLQFPLILRRWKKGDYMYPLGLYKRKSPGKTGKKKLSDIFSDLKLSLPEKEKTWILLSGEKIAWVAGIRLDDRFKVTGKTRKIFRIERKSS